MNETGRRQMFRGPSVWTAPTSRAMWRQLLHCSRFTDAIMPSSLAGIRKVSGRSAFTSAVGVTFHGNVVPIFEAYQHLEDVDQDNVALSPCGSTWSIITGSEG